jgi:predicted nucleic acid-binding protein
LILDASVAAKWFLPDEPFLHEARAVRTAVLAEVVDLAAPATLWTEISNAIVRAVHRGRVDAELARQFAEQMVGLTLVELVLIDARDTIDTALRLGLDAYDAQYLALGSRLARTVITADRRMFEVGRASGYDVAWLGHVRPEGRRLAYTP